MLTIAVNIAKASNVVPSATGGPNEIDNLAFSCSGCNGHKSIATTVPDPATGVNVLLFRPRKDEWLEHFAWSRDYTYIIGLTPVGRATIARLQLNRQELIELREILRTHGVHPPQL